MPNVTLSPCPPEGAAQRRTPQGNQKRKNKWFRKKMQYLQRKGHLEGAHKHSHHHRAQPRPDGDPRHNGAYSEQPVPATSSQNKSLPHAGGGAPRCSSGPSAAAHSLPSRTFTVSNKGGHEKPKEPPSTKPAAGTPGPSGSTSHKHAAAAAAAAAIPTKYLAVDCEMVGAGPKGSISQLARCSIVSYEGDVVYDKFINPPMPVTDYRTRWSGIRQSDLVKATPYSEARKEILRLLMGKVVVGHAVHNDFKVLGYSHPAALTRDTSRIPLLNLRAGFAENECASLKRLTKAIFNRDIQTGRRGHSSVEDAKATMELYKVVEPEWERRLASKPQAS